MAKEDKEDDFEEVDEWRIFLLFVVIIIIDFVWETADFRLTRHFRKQSKGLTHAWEKLKFEIMALGVISLLLVVFEEYLLKICIDSTKDSELDDAYSPTEAPGRRLLAVEADCPDGKEPLWSSALIHKLHILIFLIAISHVLYAGLSLTLSMWSINRWKKFEEVAKNGELQPLPTNQLRKEGESRVIFGVRQCIRQFTHPIDVATYVALRTMFFEQIQLEEEFNFAEFVSDFLTEEFSKIIELELVMWLLAATWIILPAGSYAALWTTGIFLFLSLAAGAKLHSVAADLARYIYSLYYDEESLSRELQDSSPHLSGMQRVQLHHQGAVSAGARISSGPIGEAEEGVSDSPLYLTSPNMSQSVNDEARLPMIREHHSSELGSRLLGASQSVKQAADALHESQSMPERSTAAAQPELVSAQERDASLDKGAANGQQHALVSATTGVSELRSDALRKTVSFGKFSPPRGEGGPGSALPDTTSSGRASGTNGISRPSGCIDDKWKSCFSGGSGESDSPTSPKSPRRVGKRGKRFARFLRGHSGRVKRWSAKDFSQLFWFNRPQLLLRIFQYTYFENALSLAVLIFAFWQHESTLFDGAFVANDGDGDVVALTVSCVLLLIDCLLLVHSAVYVLPVYALTAASVNFGSHESLLDYAKRRGIRPEMVEFLQATESAQLDKGNSGAPQSLQRRSNLPSVALTEPTAIGRDTINPANRLPSAAAPALARLSPGGPGISSLPTPDAMPRLGLSRASCPVTPSLLKPSPGLPRASNKIAMPVKRSMLARRSDYSAVAGAMGTGTGSGQANVSLGEGPATTSPNGAIGARPSLSRASCPVRPSTDRPQEKAQNGPEAGATEQSGQGQGPSHPSPQTAEVHGLTRLSDPGRVKVPVHALGRDVHINPLPKTREEKVHAPSVDALVQSMFKARVQELERSHQARTSQPPQGQNSGGNDRLDTAQIRARLARHSDLAALQNERQQRAPRRPPRSSSDQQLAGNNADQ